MTEEEWLHAGSFWLLGEHLRRHRKATRSKIGRRKFQLFNCASLRVLFWEGFDENTRQLVVAFEQFSDGEIDKDELDKASANLRAANLNVDYALGKYAHGIYGYIRSLHLYDQLGPDKARHQCDLLRHIFGNPFRPHPPLPHVPTALRNLAEPVYQQEQANVGPLHDALLDAGLPELADHFRDAVECHPKGCWALDLLTGRA